VDGFIHTDYTVNGGRPLQRERSNFAGIVRTQDIGADTSLYLNKGCPYAINAQEPMRFLASIAFLGIFLSGSLRLDAQEVPCTHLTVAVSLVDRKGAPVANCDQGCFRAVFRGKPVRIQSVSGPTSPLRVVIVLDASGSMNRPGKWGVALFTARDIIRTTPPQSTFALVVFGSDVLTRVDFDRGNGAVLRALDGLNANRDKTVAGHGRTGLFDAILKGVQILDQPKPGDTIFVVSDGGDNASHSVTGEVAAALQSSGVRLFAAVLGYDRTPTPEEMPDRLEDLARTSGGYSLRLTGNGPFSSGTSYDPTPKYLDSISLELQKVFLRMTTYYRLEIEAAEQPKKLENWKLEIDPGMKEKLKGAQISYPHKIGPCGRDVLPKETK
jgi:hypothetical protein